MTTMGLFGSSKDDDKSRVRKEAVRKLREADQRRERIADEDRRAHRARGGKGGAPESKRWLDANAAAWKAHKEAKRAGAWWV